MRSTAKIQPDNAGDDQQQALDLQRAERLAENQDADRGYERGAKFAPYGLCHPHVVALDR